MQGCECCEVPKMVNFVIKYQELPKFIGGETQNQCKSRLVFRNESFNIQFPDLNQFQSVNRINGIVFHNYDVHYVSLRYDL